MPCDVDDRRVVHRRTQRGAHRFDIGEDLAARDGRRGDATGSEQREIANLGPGRCRGGCAADSDGGAIGCADAA